MEGKKKKNHILLSWKLIMEKTRFRRLDSTESDDRAHTRFSILRTRYFGRARESVGSRIVNFSTCLLFVLSGRSIFYRAFNQRGTTAPGWSSLAPAHASVNLPSKLPVAGKCILPCPANPQLLPPLPAWATVSQITGALFRCRRNVTAPRRTPISGMAYFCLI